MAFLLYNNTSLVLLEFDSFIKAASKENLRRLNHYSFAAIVKDLIANPEAISSEALITLINIKYGKPLNMAEGEVRKILIAKYGDEIARFIRSRLNVSFDEYYNGYNMSAAILP